MNIKPYSFILVTEDLINKDINKYFNFLVNCSKHGITAVQLRNKSLHLNNLLINKIKKLNQELLKNNVTLFINDSYKTAKKVNSSALHVGQQDDSPFLVNSAIKSPLIGLSVNTISQAKQANSINFLNYIGVGAIFATQSKNTENIWGLNGLKEVKKQSCHNIVAIGGITEQNCKSVLQNGANGIAIIADIHNAKNPNKKIANIRQIIEQYN